MRVSADIILNRQQQILERLQQQQKLSIDEIAEMFGITPSSVRRQLQDMEEKGLVTRTYKGVMLAPDWEFEEDVRSRRYAQTLEKRAIAKKALEYIGERDIILLGNGTTTLEVAKQLKNRENLIIITTSVPVAAELYNNPGIEVQMVGGIVRPYTGSIVGPQSLRFLEGVHFSKAFIGADSISLENGITTPNQIEVDIDRFVIENSAEVFVLADHSKFDKVTLAHLTDLDQIDYIITDTQNSSQCIEALKKRSHPRVLEAPVDYK